MCGNFGLIMLGQGGQKSLDIDEFEKKEVIQDAIDISMHQSLHEVSRLHGLRVVGDANWTHNISSNGRYDVIETTSAHAGKAQMLKPLHILEAQTAATEIRGGQAGGISSIEYAAPRGDSSESHFESKFAALKEPIANIFRVRCVARKRYPLAKDLATKFLRLSGREPDPSIAVTFVGHTRFATSSVNLESELHPHEWVPARKENVWRMTAAGKMERACVTYCLHLSHNGDFDALEMYSSTVVNGDIGLWLTRILHHENTTRGDSAKLAGMMDVIRVQGRWPAAVRLAYSRLLRSVNDVCDGTPLARDAPNTFPPWEYFEDWAITVFEPAWSMHKNSIIRMLSTDKKHAPEYTIDRSAEKQMVSVILKSMDQYLSHFEVNNWSKKEKFSFVNIAVRSFLRNDLYTSLTEILARAEGSFGIQTHCTIETGVVVIASKGQPMSVAFSPDLPICLYGSEAEAIAVPVDVDGGWLPERIDLDSKGEVIRLGRPKYLVEGEYANLCRDGNSSHGREEKHSREGASSGRYVLGTNGDVRANAAARGFRENEEREKMRQNIEKIVKNSDFGVRAGIRMKGGMEILSYSLVSNSEAKGQELVDRAVTINSAPIPYDPKADLVKADLAMLPGIIEAIDRAWANPKSVEYIVAEEFCRHMIKCMKHRVDTQTDSTDLLIGGVEASLWAAEQFAADLRTIFPQLNVVTVSANKLLGLADDAAGKVFFPGTDAVLRRRIDDHTCALLISQSGQTFATLHATRKVASVVGDRLFLMTGCFNSKMEVAMKEYYDLNSKVYGKNRVFNNYSGYRPAEPTSAAIVATFHTLTRLILHLAVACRKTYAGCRRIHIWDYVSATEMLRKLVRRKRRRRLERMLAAGEDVGDELLDLSNHGINLSNHGAVARLSPRPHGNRSVSRGVSMQSGPTAADAGNGGGVKDFDAVPAASVGTVAAVEKEPDAAREQFVPWYERGDKVLMMNLTDGCLDDIHGLIATSMIPNIERIVGYDVNGNPLPAEKKPSNMELREAGQSWGAHIAEPWNIIVCVAIYLLVSVGLGLPLFGTLASIILAILRAAGIDLGDGQLTWSPRNPDVMSNQGIGWTLVGLALQIIDAIWFIYIGKNITWFARWLSGRPMDARMGARTIVVVDTPCVHQLTENFASKLFSQAYSFCMPNVHGASGLDHFVHRFTHRVVRGVLLAVGRPDGRLCVLAKSEAALLLAVKQAVFIQNPAYDRDGTGPDVITIGHNPYAPNLGLCRNIVLQSDNRRQFVDEYLYDRLYLATKPFTKAILAQLSQAYSAAKLGKNAWKNIPYGVQHVNPFLEGGELFTEFVFNTKESGMLTAKQIASGQSNSSNNGTRKEDADTRSCDPAVRIAFNGRLDRQTKQVEDLQQVVQQFYECRVAAVERYVSFCVMFHAMAEHCHEPWFCVPWDMARSQSNLRVATTASPVANDGTGHHVSNEIKKVARDFAAALKGFSSNF